MSEVHSGYKTNGVTTSLLSSKTKRNKLEGRSSGPLWFRPCQQSFSMETSRRSPSPVGSLGLKNSVHEKDTSTVFEGLLWSGLGHLPDQPVVGIRSVLIIVVVPPSRVSFCATDDAGAGTVNASFLNSTLALRNKWNAAFAQCNDSLLSFSHASTFLLSILSTTA